MFKQVTVLFRWNLMSAKSRIRPILVSIIGFAGVVAVFVSVLSVQQGFEFVSNSTGSSDVGIIIRSDSKTELSSVLKTSDIHAVSAIIDQHGNNQAHLVSPELLLVVGVPKKESELETSVPLRGLHANSLALRDEIQIMQGRMFKPGLYEIIIGRGVMANYAGMNIGNTVHWGRHDWKIVGVFTANGNIHESEVWTDGNVLKAAYERGNIYQSMYFKFEADSVFEKIKKQLEKDTRLPFSVLKESEYYKSQSEYQSQFISTIGVLITIIMSIGAIFGAINMMYSAVASRRSEIGIMRAVGFNRSAVLISILTEGMLIGLIGGLIGGGVAYMALNGYQTSMVNFESFSQVVFAFSVNGELLETGIIVALIMGFIGGLPSSFSAARAPIITLLKSR